MKDTQELYSIARQLRIDSLKMITLAKSGHPGGSLSAADIMAVLYFRVMNHKPENPEWEDRDRFVLSKGHACPVLYAALARSGYFPVQELDNLRQINSRLQGHPSKKDLPGIEASTGSLGQGLSIAVGMALALDKKDNRIFCMIGDGELQEGQVWEAAMCASHYKLENLCAIIDRNKVQLCGPTHDVMCVCPLKEKWESFGWHVIEINGHDIEEIIEAFEYKPEKPVVIIANTVKGKGVSFMEDKAEWHGKAPTQQQLEKALEEL